MIWLNNIIKIKSFISCWFIFCSFSLVLENLVCDIATSYQGSFQDAATPFMEGLIDLHNDLWFYLFGVLGFLIIVMLCVFTQAPCTRKRNFKKGIKLVCKPSLVQHNTLLETIWTLIPCVILVLAAAPSFTLLYEAEQLGNVVYSFKVIGNQWFWTFEVPYQLNSGCNCKIFESYGIDEADLVTGMPRLLAVDKWLTLPIRAQIRVMVSSTDVLHSFCVPSLGIKVDACPGRVNQVGLWISRTGVFYGQCSEICGIRHGFMPVVVNGVSYVGKTPKVNCSDWSMS